MSERANLRASETSKRVGERANNTRKLTMRPTYDAIVLGTGFGGSVAACRLSQAGLSVAVLERGRRYDKGTSFPRDYSNLGAGWLWQDKQGLFDVKEISEMTIVQSAGYGGGS